MPEQEPLTIPTSEFWEAVRRSRVVADETLGAVRAEILSTSADVATGDDPTEDDFSSAAATAKRLIEKEVLTRYQAKELLQGRFRRLRMDHFVIRDLLGVGGMGSVFRAYDEQRGEEVALKVLSERFKHDAGMRARFRLEARAGMRLEHPGIVKTYELGVTDDVFGEVDYATMELFEGIALHELVGIMGPIPVNAACDVICQTSDALGYIHSQGMVHRDVKPDNVLIDRDGTVKIIDFGLTLVDEADDESPAEGEEFSLALIFGHDCLGTPDYMPPEQAADSRKADVRSDVYGLGCTLYVALTGKRPFHGKLGSEIINLHKLQPPPDPRAVVETTPPEVARAVLKMLAKSPEDRFQSMAEVREELHRFATRRKIEFSFTRLIHNRMALAIKQGRISQRRTSTAMHLSTAGQRTSHRTFSDGAGSTAALQATNTARDTTLSRQGSRVGGERAKGRRVSPAPAVSAASGAEDLLRSMDSSNNDQQAAASGAMLRLPEGGLYRLTQSDVVIGRQRSEVDLCIDDKRLSARHCRLTFDGDQWRVMDLESRNGTAINGQRIAIAPIYGQDQLTLSGEVTLTMEWSRRRRTSSHRWIVGLAVATVVIAILFGVYWFM